MKTTLGHQRLAKLARFLYRVPRTAFDMAVFKREPKGNISLTKSECNTAACAIGWASILFADEGFRLVRDLNCNSSRPIYAGRQGWAAVRHFFGLPVEDESLFLYRRGYEGPRQVAKLIKRYLKTGKV